MAARKNIAVYPPPMDPGVVRLLHSLSVAFDICFSPIDSPGELRHDAVLLLADKDGAILRTLAAFPAIFSAPAAAQASEPVSGPVLFANHESLALPLRGLELPSSLNAPLARLELPGFTSLSSISGESVWSEHVEHTAVVHCRVNIPVDGLSENEDLIDVLHEKAFISLLPLIDFLRRITDNGGWESADLRATLIFDDPNLHSKRYGHIDYKSLADHCRLKGFHACMATIPVDGWLIDSQAAAIFRNNRDVLSLAVHGNDHEYKEFARMLSPDGTAQVVNQAVSRVAGIERRSGLPIAKVMVPPHGACSGNFLDVLAQAGFHGATTTRGAIWENNDIRHRRPGTGVALAEIVCGLPIVHRFRFNTDRWRHRVAMSAYLKQPLIAYGHHDDFAVGLNAFDRIAQCINGLGATWLSPAELFASNYETRRTGSTLHIRPFSRHIVVSTDEDCREITLDLERFADHSVERIAVTMGTSAQRRHVPAERQTSIPLAGGGKVALSLESGDMSKLRNVPERRTRLTSAARRVVSECRDRCTWLRV